MSKIKPVRGMNDLPPDEVKAWVYAEKKIKKVFSAYGYQEIRFPIIERTDLFVRSNEAADIVTKQMYSFEDKGGESISLRPEGTAGCVRAAIDNDLLRTDNPKLWYSGPMFRYERPQKGRSRQFIQFSAEVFGIRSAEIDAELILLTARLWKELGLEKSIRLEINNIGDNEARKSYVKSLRSYFKTHQSDLDDDSVRKLKDNPLRILDSKSPAIKKILTGAPEIEEFISQDSKDEFSKLTTMLDNNGIDFLINSKLVRGLDYYNQTVFEWKSDVLGSQDTVCGGGRYDNLVEELGGRPCPAIGFSIGMERLILSLKSTSFEESNIRNIDFYFICLAENSIEKAIMYSESIRDKFPSATIKINMGMESAGSQFKKADKSGASFALILGEEELETNTLSLKDLRSKSKQENLTDVDLDKRLKEIYK